MLGEDLRLAAEAALRLDKLEREQKWREDPFSWFVDCASLIDPLAQGEKIAPFPNFPYLKELIGEINTHNAVVLWKSRRMIASWSAIAYAVWMCMHFKHVRCYFISRKEGATDGEGSRELIWRAQFIATHLRNTQAPKLFSTKLHIDFLETGSSITGISCEPNAMRQVSANLVVADEFAFWDHPREAYAALKPTLEARGKFVGISSSAEGFFKDIVTDAVEMDMGGEVRGGISSVPGRGVIIPKGGNERFLNANTPDVPGFCAWTNPINKFRIVAMHYTADPRKREPAWKKREQEGMPLSLWLQEYEMSFGVRSGMPVYIHEWRPATMLVEGLKTERNRPILVSLDFGFHNPAAVVGQMRYGLQLILLRAFQGKQLRFEDFMHQIMANLRSWFPGRNPENPDDVLWCCDAAGDQEHSTGEAEVKILRRVFGLRPKFRKVLIPPTLDIVRGYMSRTYRGEPCFLVDHNPSTALLVEGLNGGYSYPEGEVNETTTPDKDNIYDHLQDCHDDKTEVLTANGWKLFKDVMMNEPVATVNLQTDRLEYQVPTAHIAKNYTGDMITIGGKLDVCVTPNHRMLAYKRKSTGYTSTPTFVRAEDLSIWDKLKLTTHWEGQDSPVQVSQHGTYENFNLDRGDLAEFFGWYVAEGSYVATPKFPGAGYGVHVSQTPGVKREILRACLNKTPWTWQENAYGFYTSSKQLWSIVQPLGTCYDKYVPQWIKDSSSEIIERFIYAAVCGDGWRSDGCETYATVSKRLADDMQELYIKVGATASVIRREAKPYTIRGRSGSNTVPQFWVSRWKTTTATLRNAANVPNYTRIPYSGMVYCLTVPNSTLITRRNGKPLIAGNCVRYMAVNFGGARAQVNRGALDAAAVSDILSMPTYVR